MTEGRTNDAMEAARRAWQQMTETQTIEDAQLFWRVGAKYYRLARGAAADPRREDRPPLAQGGLEVGLVRALRELEM